MSTANHSAVCPATGHTETFATAAAQHSEPAEDDSELQSDAGESPETRPAEKEEISQTAAKATTATTAV